MYDVKYFTDIELIMIWIFTFSFFVIVFSEITCMLSHLFLNRPDDIYHVTIMPCYDKKLEASREDFYNDIYRTRDVDCVISTSMFYHYVISLVDFKQNNY